MQFLKSAWAFLVGVKDALALVLLVALFGGLWAAMSTSSRVATVPQGAALHIELDGILVDQAQDRPLLAAITGEQIVPETETARLVRAIDLAAEDSSIKMITLDLDGFLGGGLANLESVGAALTRFRAKGKQVEAWATAYGDDGYFLAAHADSIGLSPMGAVLIAGPGGSGLYFKDALDKLKVDIEVFRVGTYKSFVEPFTRNESSPEARAADQTLADDLWASWRSTVQKQRQELDFNALLASWPARIAGANQSQALIARDAGLVDIVQTNAAWHRALREKLGEGEDPGIPGDFKRVSGGDYMSARDNPETSGPAVAVVHINGAIVDGEAGPGQAGGDTITALIEDALADEDVKALVMRIDSGGGSALASEQIRQAMQDARARKMPVIASFGPVAASGGYWIGAGADAIYASPSTITGSIGVFGIIPTFERTLKDIGISSDGVSTTPFSGQPDIVGGLNDPTRALIQGSVGDIYRQFIVLVSASRKLPVAEVEKVAEGRVWSGVRAKELRLIDGFGDLDTAVAEAGRRAGIGDKPRIMVMSPPKPFLVQLLSQMEGTSSTPPKDALARAVTISRMRAAAQVEAAIAVAAGPTIQAHCLTCMRHAVPRGRADATADVLRAIKARALD